MSEIDFSDLTTQLQLWVPNQLILLCSFINFIIIGTVARLQTVHLLTSGHLLSPGRIETYIFIFILKEIQMITISNDMYIIYFSIFRIKNFCKCVASKLFTCSFTRLWNEKWIKQKQGNKQRWFSGSWSWFGKILLVTYEFEL